MKLGERLKKLRKAKNLTQQSLAEKIGVSTQMIVNYENEVRGLTIKKLEEIAYLLEVPLYTFFIDNYDDYLLSFNDEKINNIILNETSRIPVISKVSAGKGVIVEENISFYISIPKNIWKECDFATIVDGDSMSPIIEDGEIVFVHFQNTLENGQIGIFSYKDEIYIKKYKYNVIRNDIELISNNPTYEKIVVKNTEDFKIIGRVLGNLNYSL